ncbi:MAG: hypothetical protein IMHGJWDQ_001451, partial [Candidatus Fervidibacter sp.]
SWVVSGLWCVEHEATDGLKAHPEGLLHGVILRVPVSVMEKAGVYRFVLHFYDDYADSYKNHQVKAALDRNQSTVRERLDIWVSTLPDNNFLGKIYWNWIIFAFETVAKIPLVVHPGDTAGQEETYWLGIGRTSIRFRSLSRAQKKRACRRTVIVMGYPSGSGKPGSTAERSLTPEDPALSIVFTNVVDENHPDPADLNAASMSINGYTNTLIHELTHVANDNDNHCSQNVSTCIWRSSINDYFFYNNSKSGIVYAWYNLVSYTWKGSRVQYYSLWHSLDEINEMRRSMRLIPLR